MKITDFVDQMTLIVLAHLLKVQPQYNAVAELDGNRIVKLTATLGGVEYVWTEDKGRPVDWHCRLCNCGGNNSYEAHRHPCKIK